MTRISLSLNGDTPFQQLLGHNAVVMEAWTNLGDILEKDGSLSSDLKEQVRRALAQENGCEYCKAKGKPDPRIFNEKISLAVAFAEIFLKYRGRIKDAQFRILKQSFTEQEISELCAFTCFTSASQFFGGMLDLNPSDIYIGTDE